MMVLEEKAGSRNDSRERRVVRCENYGITRLYVCKGVIQSLLKEGAVFRDCRGIRRMEVMCKVGIIDFSMHGKCARSRNSEGKGRRGEEGKMEEGSYSRVSNVLSPVAALHQPSNLPSFNQDE
jgi:hypothetical protein